jgi:hypothetical protein
MDQSDTPCRQEAGMKTARRIAATKALIGVAGLIAVVSAIATGNWTVVVIAAAVSGVGLLAAVADLRAVEARSEAARMRNQASAGIEPERDVRPEIQERLSELKGYYARLESEPEGAGRFQELVAADDSPGWDRQP